MGRIFEGLKNQADGIRPMFYLIGIVVTFFLATILITKRGKTEADVVLAVWLVTIGIHLASFYLFITRVNFSFPYLLGLELPFPLLHGPLLYLYTEAVTNQVSKRKIRLLHFVPFFLAYLLFVPFFLSPADHKIFVYKNNGLGYETLTGVLLLAIIISGIVYVVLSLRLLKKHQRIIQNQFSYAEKINLAWLRYLIYGIAAIWIVVIFGDDKATYSTVVVFVIMLGYFGIKQVGIFTQRLPAETKSDLNEVAAPAPVSISTALPDPAEPGIEEPKKAKYLKSSLNADTAENIYTGLTQLMREKKPYTNPELTLDELAQTLNVHRNNLSQVINTYEQKSFYDYVNLKRVEEFKRIVSLPESQKFTLLGLANNSGFNSKTSFNRNFKNATGLSPTEYLKQAHILLEQ
jgi:AraC-like DNA-binding protein